VHGLVAPLRQFLRFTRTWERVLLGVVLFVIGAVLNFNVVSALGVVIIGVTILGAVRRRRGTGVVAVADETGTATEVDVSEQ
jgi:hypothetical protein